MNLISYSKIRRIKSKERKIVVTYFQNEHLYANIRNCAHKNQPMKQAKLVRKSIIEHVIYSGQIFTQNPEKRETLLFPEN